MQRIGIGQQQRMHSRMVTHQRKREASSFSASPSLLFPHRPSRIGGHRTAEPEFRRVRCASVARFVNHHSALHFLLLRSLPSLRNPGPRTHAVNPCLTAAAYCMSGPPSVCPSICHAGFSARSLTEEVEDRPRLMFPTKLQPFPPASPLLLLRSSLRSLIELTSLSLSLPSSPFSLDAPPPPPRAQPRQPLLPRRQPTTNSRRRRRSG